MADNLNVTPGSGSTLRMIDTGDGFLRQVGTLGAVATEGALSYQIVGAASINASVVKASPGNIYGIVASNLNAAVRYLKLYNKATTPAPGTDTALLVMTIPLRVSTDPIVITTPVPIKFSAGISFVLVTGIAYTDATAVAANEQVVNIIYA